MGLDSTYVWMVLFVVWTYVTLRSLALWLSYRDLMIGLLGMVALALLGVAGLHILDDMGPFRSVLSHARTAAWGRSLHMTAGVLFLCAICMYDGSRHGTRTWVDKLRGPLERYYRGEEDDETSTSGSTYTGGGEPAP